MTDQIPSFDSWKSSLVYNNDSDAIDNSYLSVQSLVYQNLTIIHKHLHSLSDNTDSTSNDHLLYIYTQLSSFVDYILETYPKSKEIKFLSTNLMNLLAKSVSYNLLLLMKNGHEKFNISLIDLVNKLVSPLLENVKKLSMSKNWYSSIKHLSIILLKFIFTNFNGFLNNLKNSLVTLLYKHLSKANDSYNSSIESGNFKSNYFSDIIHLIDIILTHDNSNNVLDDKLYNRLIKLHKFTTQKNTSSSGSTSSASSSSKSNINLTSSTSANSGASNSNSSSVNQSSFYTYPLISVIHSHSIITSILKSDMHIASITSNKKTNMNATKYLSSLKDYINQVFSDMDTDHKKLKLSLTKNLSDLLVYTFIVFGYNINEVEYALESCLSVLLNEYKLIKTSSNLKSSILETIVQFLSKMNLYYQTDRIQISRSSSSINFVSLKLFDILNIIYTKLFDLSVSFPIIENSKSNKKSSSTDSNSGSSILIDNSISMNFAIKTLNHLSLLHKFLIKELDNDVNKLILLSKLILGNSKSESSIKIKCLDEIVNPNNTDEVANVWYASNLLSFSQLLIESLNEFVLSDHGSLSSSDINTDIASQLVHKVKSLTLNKNFRLRVIACETLVKLLKIKPELSFEIMNQSLNNLSASFQNKTIQQDQNKNQPQAHTFNSNYSNSYLISSILSFSPQEYITSDFILETYSLSLDYLKKFNTSVVSTNLFGSTNNDFLISNIDYERQIVSWILLLGIFNYVSNDENMKSNYVFLQNANQFLVLWKNLLAHSLPNGFLKIDPAAKTVTNLNEIMKIIEIKNQSLVCLITYISFLNLNDSLSDEDLIRQLNQILTKGYGFITTLLNELKSLKQVPEYLLNSISGGKLRIFEAYLKLLPHLNIKNEISSSMLIEIVGNFCDIEKFRYQFKDPFGKYIKTSKKKVYINSISEYTIYYIDDGLWYGLTSKFNNYKVDELMIKDKSKQAKSNQIESDIDLVPLHNQFLIESPYYQSICSNISVFDDTTESRSFNFLNHSLLHDSFLLLYNNSYDIGYTDTMKYPVSTDTMTVDTSIELFAISFPHLSSKIQLSVLESIRSSIFYQTKESKSISNNSNNKKASSTDESEESKIKLEFSLNLRKRAISINSSIAIHSLLNYMLRYNSNHTVKLRLQKDVANLIVETLKNIDFEDIYLVNLNSESIGICCSLVENKDIQEDVLHNQVTIIMNSIAENTNPNTRAFNVKTLSQLTKYSNIVNTSKIVNTFLTLVLDPHPVVHAATLNALDIFLNGKSNIEVSTDLAHQILGSLQKIWLSDDFGLRSSTTIVSNVNFREHSNSVNLIAKILRSLVNITGPMIRLWDDDLKRQLKFLLFNLQNLVTFDFEILMREFLKIFEELLVYDKSLIDLKNYKLLTKLLIINNFKIGVSGHSLSNLPFDNEYDNENTIECFPCTTSFKLLNMSSESAFQLFKLDNEQNDVIDYDFENLLWLALESDPDNESIQNIITILMQDSCDSSLNNKAEWYNKLIKYFNINKSELNRPLLKIFEKRINNGGMYFRSPLTTTTAKINNEKKSKTENTKKVSSVDDPSVDTNEDKETLTSEQPLSTMNGETVKKYNTNNDGDDDDDDDDEGEYYYNRGATSNNDKIIHILDLSNEQINWKFKLFILGLLNELLTYCDSDIKFKVLLSKKISEFVRISFTSSVSNLISLRVSSLKLLGKVIELYSDMKDPLYPEISILDQQQAQIMSTITPSFNKESNVELSGEGIVLASKFISSNIIDVSKTGRIIKILTSSLEDIANNIGNLSNDNNSENKVLMKVGDVDILTKKSENKIKMYILQAWSKILILNEANHNSNDSINELIGTYIKVLITLWVYSLREFSMLKYAKSEYVKSYNLNEGLSLEIYESCWIDYAESISITIENKEYYGYLSEIMGDDISKLFVNIFGLCLEYLVKKSNKNSLGEAKDDIRILKTLRRLFKLPLSVKILFNDYIFSEFVDIINKLIIVASDIQEIEILSNVDELISNIFIDYFEDLTVNNKEEKSIEEIYSDFDKLFELLRLIIKIINMKLTFISKKEILDNDSNGIILDDSYILLLKKCFSSFIEMISLLPKPIQIDLYCNLLYMLVLVHEFKNSQLITILLPVYQKCLSNYKGLIGEEIGDNNHNNKNLKNIFKILKIDSKLREDQLLAFIILKTVPEINIDSEDVAKINTIIIEGLKSQENTILSLSIQTVKSIINNISNDSNNNSSIIFKGLIPLLINLLNNDNEGNMTDSRIMIEILMTFVKKIVDMGEDEKIEGSYELIIPIIIYFNVKNGFDDYVHDKILELIEINPINFKKIIQRSDDELRSKIEELVNNGSKRDEIVMSKESHIELKTLG